MGNLQIVGVGEQGAALVLQGSEQERRADRLARAVAGWLDDNSRSAKTLAAYRSELAGFMTWLQQQGLAIDSEPGDVAQALQVFVKRAGRRGKGNGETVSPAPATIAQRRACISSFYTYAVRLRLLTANPADMMGKVRGLQQYRSAAPLKLASLKKLLAAIDRSNPAGLRDYALLAVGVQTGRRLSELAGLQWGDVYEDGEGVTVMWPRCKGGKSIRDELPTATAHVLLAWRAAAMLLGSRLDGVRRYGLVWLAITQGSALAYRPSPTYVKSILAPARYTPCGTPSPMP